MMEDMQRRSLAGLKPGILRLYSQCPKPPGNPSPNSTFAKTFELLNNNNNITIPKCFIIKIDKRHEMGLLLMGS